MPLLRPGLKAWWKDPDSDSCSAVVTFDRRLPGGTAVVKNSDGDEFVVVEKELWAVIAGRRTGVLEWLDIVRRGYQDEYLEENLPNGLNRMKVHVSKPFAAAVLTTLFPGHSGRMTNKGFICLDDSPIDYRVVLYLHDGTWWLYTLSL